MEGCDVGITKGEEERPIGKKKRRGGRFHTGLRGGFIRTEGLTGDPEDDEPLERRWRRAPLPLAGLPVSTPRAHVGAGQNK